MKQIINEIAWDLFYNNISSRDLADEKVFERIIYLLEKSNVFEDIQNRLEQIEENEKGVNNDY
jgi:hypothetical protein